MAYNVGTAGTLQGLISMNSGAAQQITDTEALLQSLYSQEVFQTAQQTQQLDSIYESEGDLIASLGDLSASQSGALSAERPGSSANTASL